MNVLFEKFPGTVLVNGKEYRVVTDFREWIKMQVFLSNTRKLTIHTVQMLLEWYLDPPPNNTTKEAIDALCWFLSGEGLGQEKCQEESKEAIGKSNELFSFEQDASCIYCAFRSVYGIDIEAIPYMHWWKFLVLFSGLPADTEIQERIYYRGIDLNNIKSKEERKRIKEIKKRIAIRQKKKVMSDYEIGEAFR